MTADVELLPLPEWTKRDDAGQNMVPSEMRVALSNYARACVAQATAAQAAEIEALRAEAIRTDGELHQRAEIAEARAERLAEALREITELREHHHDNLHDAIAIAGDALLRDQEGPRREAVSA